MELIKFIPKKYEMEIGFIAMTMLIAGTFAEPSSLTQKLLFLIPGPMLAYTAYAADQKLFFGLQAVITTGVIMSFFPTVPYILNYAAVVGMGLIAVGYFTETQYIKIDRFWPIAGVGILLLAFGYSTNAAREPMYFNGLLASGSLLIAVYSYIGYHKLKNKVAGIWFILNILFFIKPASYVLTHIH